MQVPSLLHGHPARPEAHDALTHVSPAQTSPVLQVPPDVHGHASVPGVHTRAAHEALEVQTAPASQVPSVEHAQPGAPGVHSVERLPQAASRSESHTAATGAQGAAERLDDPERRMAPPPWRQTPVAAQRSG